MNRLERKRPQIDPKTLRKHSHIVASKQDPLLVVGDRTQTDYGITVSGVVNKAFETAYMVVVPNSMTPTWRHAKKVRAYRVIGGSGYYQETDAGTVTTKPLSAGDEILVEAGKTHRLTSGVVKLELYVTQEAKYEANLEEVAPVETIADVDSSELRSLTAADKFAVVKDSVVGRRRSNRAAEQIATQRGDTQALSRLNNKSEKSENFFRNGASSGMNAMPVLDFSEEGAG